MGATGKIVTASGTATTAETLVPIPTAYRKGHPNANGTAPTPNQPSGFLRNVRIANLDATNNLLVRFNAGAAVTVKPNSSHSMDIGIVHRLSVASSAATVAWDLTAVGST